MTFVAPDVCLNDYDFVVAVGQHPPCHKTTDSSHIFLHPLCQSYEVFAEEIVIAMLVRAILLAHNIPLVPILKQLDMGYLSSESNFSEEECTQIATQTKDSKSLLWLGADLFLHAQALNIFALLALLHNVNLCVASPLGTLPLAPCAKAPASLPNADGIWLYVLPTTHTTNQIIGSTLFANLAKVLAGKTYCFELANLSLCASFAQSDFSGLVGILQCSTPLYGYPFYPITSFKEQV